MEHSFSGPYAPKNESSIDYSFSGKFVQNIIVVVVKLNLNLQKCQWNYATFNLQLSCFNFQVL